jgi:hypothetical protein
MYNVQPAMNIIAPLHTAVGALDSIAYVQNQGSEYLANSSNPCDWSRFCWRQHE